MRKKLKGTSPLLLKEAIAIKKEYFDNMELEELYEEQDEK